MKERAIQMLSDILLVIILFTKLRFIWATKNIMMSLRHLAGAVTRLYSVPIKKLFYEENKYSLIFIYLTQNRIPELSTFPHHLLSWLLDGLRYYASF